MTFQINRLISIFVLSSVIIEIFSKQFAPPSPSANFGRLGRAFGLSKQVHDKWINVFFGIPYAQPPVDQLRFQPPRSLQCFPQQPYFAQQFRPHCQQPPNTKFGEDHNFSEDCLHLNIFIPPLDLNTSNQNQLICNRTFPILFYIFGGVGSYNQPTRFHSSDSDAFNLAYNGEHLASKYDVITVVINYRVSMLGHIYVPGKLAGNIALRDQQHAIKFVAQQAHNFCGDAQRITLVGNSFGSMSVGMHLLSSQVNHLFRSVIMQSGSLYRLNMPLTPDQTARNSLLMAHEVGCVRPAGTAHKSPLNESNLKLLATLNSEAVLEEANFRLIGVNFFDNQPISQHLHRLAAKIHDNLLTSGANLPKGVIVSNLVNRLKSTVEDELNKDRQSIIQARQQMEIDVDCLMNKNGSELGNTGKDLFLFYFFDSDIISIESFLEYELKKHVSLPADQQKSMLIGVNQDEGCGNMFELGKLKNATLDSFPDLSRQEIYDVLDAHPIVNQFSLIKNDIIDYYLDKNRWQYRRGYADAVSEFFNDINYFCPAMFYSQDLMAPNTRVYNYLIEQVPSQHFGSGVSRNKFTHAKWIGACHADELLYLFDTPHLYPQNFSESDIRFSDRFLYVWSHFIHHGYPPPLPEDVNNDKKDSHHHPPAWPQSGFGKMNFVALSDQSFALKKPQFLKRCEQFWAPLADIFRM